MSADSTPQNSPIGPLKAWLDEPLEDRVMALVEDPSLLELVRDLIEQLKALDERIHQLADQYATRAALVGSAIVAYDIRALASSPAKEPKSIPARKSMLTEDALGIEAVLVAADRLREAYEAMIEGRDVGWLPDWQPRESHAVLVRRYDFSETSNQEHPPTSRLP